MAITRETVLLALDRPPRNAHTDLAIARMIATRLTVKWRAYGQTYPEHVREYDEIKQLVLEVLRDRR